MITRLLQSQLERYLFRGRTLVLYGARRVGKTTLVKQLLATHADKRTRYLNCDLLSVRRAGSGRGRHAQSIFGRPGSNCTG